MSGVLAPGLALVFDMDGVVVDSNPAHREAWVAFNRRYGLETTGAMLERMYGKRNDWIVRDFFGDSLPPEEVERRGSAKEQLYREMMADRVKSMLVPGLVEFLERYRESPIGLATNGEPANADFVLDGAGIRGFFRVIVNGHQVKNPKPDPEIYLRVSSLLNVNPSNCVVFEDSLSGVNAAKAAGMRVIGIGTTHGNLPGTSLTVDNFTSGILRSWLAAQVAAT